MIILPHTPPLPKQVRLILQDVPGEMLSLRGALMGANLSSYNDSINFVSNLENYLNFIIKLNEEDASFTKLSDIIIAETIPWTKFELTLGDKPNTLKLISNLKEKRLKWSMLTELQVVLLSLSLTYIRIGSEISNSIISNETNEDEPQSYDNSWKLIMYYYKKSISFMLYGQKMGLNQNSEYCTIDFTLFPLISKVGDVAIQLSILAKFLWINRFEYEANEQLQLESSTTLAKVSIYVINEINVIQAMMRSTSSVSIHLKFDEWLKYFTIVEKYANAYAGLFLSMHFYKDKKIGNSIGLVHYGLLSLQSRKIDSKDKSFIKKVVSLINDKHNDQLLTKFNSISTLNIDKSAFKEKSAIILVDVYNVFDMLIKLNLKFTKENDNIYFDKVVHYNEISKDSKWPIGCKVPISAISPYDPTMKVQEQDYSGKGAYY